MLSQFFWPDSVGYTIIRETTGMVEEVININKHHYVMGGNIFGEADYPKCKAYYIKKICKSAYASGRYWSFSELHNVLCLSL